MEKIAEPRKEEYRGPKIREALDQAKDLRVKIVGLLEMTINSEKRGLFAECIVRVDAVLKILENERLKLYPKVVKNEEL